MKLYKEIVDKLSRIGTDKYLHFIICLTISLIISDITKSVLLGVSITFLIGILKELFDKYVQGEKFDIDDIKADVIGTMHGTMLYALGFL